MEINVVKYFECNELFISNSHTDDLLRISHTTISSVYRAGSDLAAKCDGCLRNQMQTAADEGEAECLLLS